MPTPFLKNLADKTGKPIKDLERYWKDAQDQVGDNYALITAIVKKRAGLKEKFLESTLSAKIFIETIYL